MKKLFLSVALASAVAFASNAQDMTSKKGVPILPEAGDWSIGFDATNLIEYFGNLANGNLNNNHSSLGPQQNLTLVGLYVKDESTSYRGRVRIGFGSNTVEGAVTDSTTTPTKVETSNGFALTLGAGLQKNRGKGRLRGIYGAELDIMLGGGADVKNTFTEPSAPVIMSHITENKSGSTFGVGLNGFIGAEFFFAAKMSLSAEYQWGLNFSSTGEGEVTNTTWDAAGAATSTTAKGQKSSSMLVDVTNAGSIVFHCYF
jgi:hypothetical protein